MQILVLLALFLGYLPLSADPIELAKWTFETGYDVSENVYTPNDSPWTEVGAQWFNAGTPIIIANESVCTLSDYTVTGKTSRYWQLCSGWNNHVFRVVNDTEANNISDFTDASQHNNYYELRFPTKGYKNVTVELACAYGGNAWKEAGEYLCADYNTVDADGNPVDLSQRRDTYYKTENDERIYGKAKNFLTPEEAAQYSIKNVMGGDDNWQPELLCEECDAPVVSIKDNNQAN